MTSPRGPRSHAVTWINVGGPGDAAIIRRLGEMFGLHQLALEDVSNRTNDVMKTLTIVATIFIPPSFVAGQYGVNFDHMPELHMMYGYPFALAMMGSIAAGFLYWFRRKGWLGS